MYRTHLTRLQMFHHRMLLQKDGHLQLGPDQEEKLAAAASPPSIPSTSLDISKVLSPTLPSSSDGAVLSARGESAASRRAAQRLERASARANSMRISPPQDSSHPFLHRARRQRRRKS